MALRPALAVTVLLASGCGAPSGSAPTSAGDRGAYFYERVAWVRQVLTPDVVGMPARLRDALPCTDDRAGPAVLGRVAEVDSDHARPLDPEDEDSGGRDAVITLDAATVITASGPTEPDGPVRVRVPMLGNADPDRWRESMRSLGHVLVLTEPRPGRAGTEDLVPALGGSGLGLVDAGGEVRFPGLPRDHRQGFAGSLATVAGVLDACTGRARVGPRERGSDYSALASKQATVPSS